MVNKKWLRILKYARKPLQAEQYALAQSGII